MGQRNGLTSDRLASAAFNEAKEPEARALVSRAFADIDKGFPADPKADGQRRERAARVRERMPEHARDFIACIVAQWLSARDAPSAAPAAREAAEGVSDIVARIAQAHASLTNLSEALRYSDTTEAGHDAQGLAQVVGGSLADAARALSYAREWSEELLDLLPAGAKGRAGVVGRLTAHGADEALAIALGREWLARGLTLSGGKNGGDGLDVFLGSGALLQKSPSSRIHTGNPCG